MELIWKFATANFIVTVHALNEPDWDLSWDITGDARDGLESGRYVGFCARAQVQDKEGIVLAEDYLGQCIYKSLDAFRHDHPGYFADMVRNVCIGARGTLARFKECKTRN